MGNCIDCKCDTFADGLCSSCTRDRIDNYPNVKARLQDALRMLSLKEGERLRLEQIIKDKIEHIRNYPTEYEVACGEGETCTVAERTEDILQEILTKQQKLTEVKQ